MVLTGTPRPASPGTATPPPGGATAGRDLAGAAIPEAGSRPLATLALALLTAASASGLFRVFTGYGWIGPVAGTIVVVHVLCWQLRRRRTRSPAAAGIVAVAIVLMVSWTVLGHHTFYGIPTPATWDQAVTAIRQLGTDFASVTAPVAPTTAFELIAAGGAALAAALGDWLAFRWKTPMVALLPGLAAFIFSCTSGQGPGRGPVVAAQVGAMCLFLLVERSGGEGQVWFAGTRVGVGPWTIATGGVLVAVAVVAAAAVSPTLARRDGTGILGWHSGLGSQGSERIVPNPLVDLRTRLTQYSNRPVFLVSSSVPSYWRLTSLNTFDGVTWTSTGSYTGFSSRLPGSPPLKASVRTVRASFRIEELDSVWLPAQFDPIAVQGARGVTYDPGSNSLLTPQSTSNGLDYTVTSYQYLDTLSGAELEAAPPVPQDALTYANLQLPALPGRVLALAASLTAGKATEYDKALAIQNYLRGPQFTYSLDPPSDGSGLNALVNFLFQTRTGYCQQFAGSFAVLARAAGIPTRLAVGFVQGQLVPGGAYQVTDGDYHTWPEVYFGPRFGWVPFEPTKGFSVPGTVGYAHTSGNSPGPISSTPTTAPTTVPSNGGVNPPAVTKPRSTVPPSSVPAAAPRRSAGSAAWWLLLPAAVLLWLGAMGGVPLLARRRRRRRAARTGPEAVVLDLWKQVGAELRWHGIERRADETDDEFARRASLSMRRLGIDRQWAYGGLVGLASMARRAAFAASVPPGLGEQAAVAAREIEEQLTSVTSLGHRFARLWAPPPGAWRRLGGLLRSREEAGGGSAPR